MKLYQSFSIDPIRPAIYLGRTLSSWITVMAKHQGGCLCGAVRYSTDAAPINERICHCRLCQKAIGAAFNARVLFRIDDVTIEGPLATVNTSPDLKRGFCPSCGTTMFSRRDSAGI